MKICIVNSSGNNKSVYDHTIGNELGNLSNCDGVFLDNPLLNDGSLDLPVANSCLGIQNLILNEPLRKIFLENISCGGDGKIVSTLYTLFNGQTFSDFVEVSFSGKFMTGNIGPNCGFIHGTGIKCDSNIYDAFPSLTKLRDALHKLNYFGEVLCHITSDYRIVQIEFGHLPAHFGMFSELCKNTTQDILEFIFGKVNSLEMYESIAVANLITLSPYPQFGLNPQTIHAPKGAEKHLWRSNYGSGETVLIVCHGNYLNEARKRIRRTIDNMLSFNQDLQYRIDYGLRMMFVLNAEKYKKFEETNFVSSSQEKSSPLPSSP